VEVEVEVEVEVALTYKGKKSPLLEKVEKVTRFTYLFIYNQTRYVQESPQYPKNLKDI
jgi:hypothetical protein